MTTQVSFTADAELKKKALKKAKKEGITLKTILLYSMKAYVEGKIHFGVTSRQEPEIEEIIFEDSAIQRKAKKLMNVTGK
jgi:hypothetical protein